MSGKLSGRLVLFVGGEPTAARALEEALNGTGCSVERTHQAQDARLRLTDPLRSVPDLIVLDLAVQRAWQLSLLRWLRRLPETAGLPIAVLTGATPRRDVCSALNAGADTYLTRPLQSEVLLACVAGVLRHQPELPEGPPEEADPMPSSQEVFAANLSPLPDSPSTTGEFHTSEWELFKAIEAAIGRSMRSGSPLGLIMVGVASFEPLRKDETSELVLRVMDRVRPVLSGRAALKRFERDVFCAVLAETEEREVLASVKRVLAEVHQGPVSVGQRLLKAEVSCGIAVVEPPFLTSPFRLIDRARSALERATERHSCGFWVDYPATE